jgi:tetratricopeptide (TPR) repeat protein
MVNKIPHRETAINSRQVAEEAKSIDLIIDENETNVQAVIEQLSNIVTENERKLNLINEIPHKETVISSKQVAEEARNTERAEKPERRETEQAPKGEARVKTEEVKSNQGSNDALIGMQEGIALLESGKNYKALEAFVKVIELDPKNAVAWRKKGTVLGMLGRHEEALEACIMAIDIDPKDITARHNKVIALTKLGRKKEAKEAEEDERRVKKESEKAANEKAKR